MVDALGAAVELEGHPDNVAACLYGGLTLAVADRVVPLTVAEGLAPVVLIPPYAASTAQARRLLPATVPHSDAAANSARAALLVEALRTGDPELLLIATEDRLHQTYRAPAMPETANLVSKLRADGLPAVVSGAGPTVLCFGEPSVPPDGWRLLRLEIDRRGAVVQE
jgi:homoserine kinase